MNEQPPDNWLATRYRIFSLQTDINTKRLAKQILKNESKIIKKFPGKSIDGAYDFDGGTGLGYDSLTSRSCHFNLLDWWGTRSLRKWIRKGWEGYHELSKPADPLYVQCWANVMRKGEKIQSHCHDYREEITPDFMLTGHMSVQVDGSTCTWYEGKPILNEEGWMTLIPGNLHHWTDRYENDGHRITIAFDILSEFMYQHYTAEKYKNTNHWIKV
jgi:hypothetical protein